MIWTHDLDRYRLWCQAQGVGEFANEDLTGARFEHVRLTGADFRDVDLGRSRFRRVNLAGAVLRGADLRNLDIDGWVDHLRINGVDVTPLIEAELDRLHPERRNLRPSDPAGFRQAWDIVVHLWAETVDRAVRLPPALLHESVDDEWSFIQTLRHLVFATDAWVARAVLGDPSPWDALDLPHDELPDTPGVPRDRLVRPSLEEVLELRADRQALVRRVINELTDERLAGMTEPVTQPGYPESSSFRVRECLLTVIDEEWAHRQFAERDLEILKRQWT